MDALGTQDPADRGPGCTEIEWQFDALDLRPVERWLAGLHSATPGVASPTVNPPDMGMPIPASAPERQTTTDPSGDVARLEQPPQPGGPLWCGDGSGTSEAVDLPGTSDDEPATSGRALDSAGAKHARTAGDTLTCLAKPARRIVDQYFDTADWRIARAGFVLRVRHRGRLCEATLKARSPSSTSGLRRRTEISEALASGDPSLLSVDGPVGERVRAVAGRHALEQVLEVRTRRRPFALRVAGQEIAETVLDDTTIAAGDQQPVRLRRVEVEVDPRWVQALKPVVADLAERCGLRPASLSKLEAGLLGLGLAPGSPCDLGPSDVAPDSTFGELARATLRRQLTAFVAHEPGTRLGEDPEELHDMRVATRRLRAALDLFGDALPQTAQEARAELGWLGRLLGTVRDLDVQLARRDAEVRLTAGLFGDEEGHPLDALFSRIATDRAQARRDLLQALDSDRCERLLGALVGLARDEASEPTLEAQPAAVLVLPELVNRRHRSASKAAHRAHRTGAPEDFHRLRIRCKRLRYCVEFATDLYGRRAQSYVRRLVKLQDMLGALQDGEVAIHRLQHLAFTSDHPLPPRTTYAMGALSAHHRIQGAKILRRLARRTPTIDGSEWQGLERVVEHRRLDALTRLASEAVPERMPAQGSAPIPGASPEPSGVATPGAPPVPGAPRRGDESRAAPGPCGPGESKSRVVSGEDPGSRPAAPRSPRSANDHHRGTGERSP